MRLLLLLLLLPWAALAQELPPPGGWPLRPVTELRAVPEPPGGLVPYRQGALWGFADTTGRVWIRPVFTAEPARFGAGLLLQTEQQAPKEYTPRRVFRRVGAGSYGRQKKSKANRQRETNEPRSKGFELSSNMRYGHWVYAADGALSWALLTDKPDKNGRTWLLNARGEQVIIRADKAIEQAPNGSWRAAARRGPALARPELVAIASHELEAGALRPGQLFTVPLARRAPVPPRRLTRRRAYYPDADFTASFTGSTPLYLAQKVNWLRPTHQVLRNGRCGDRFEDTDTRYRHKGQFALFDARGHRLTDYRYSGMKRLLPQRLAYWHWSDSIYHDENAAQLSGLPQRWEIIESTNGPARRYGLLDQQGREITPPLYARLEAVGPNSLWVVAVRGGRLLYGLIDTLGRYHLPLRPEPISLPDAAGLLRRYSTAPLPAVKSSESFQLERRYPDTTTVQYLHSDGRPAFAGRYTRAGAFWEGRALVRQNGLVGILDTLGRWVLPPQPDELNYYAYSAAQRRQSEAVDPLELFDQFDGYQPMSGYYGTLPGDPLLLLAHGQQGYGLRDGHQGQEVVPTIFAERPQQWYGGVVGQRQGQPIGYSYTGRAFNPNLLTSYPLGVWQPQTYVYRPLLQRTEQGWRTRGGRQLWQD
jgi:hypothetical protein